MTRIIVRAADTALAMDEVLERLGTGAFILSTRSEPGGVVIEAATEPVSADRPAVVADFAEELAARLRNQPPEEQRPAVDPDWMAAVAGELSGYGAGPLSELAGLFPVDPSAWQTERLVLVGPITEELVQTAVRLAVAFRLAEPTCRTEMMSCPRRTTLPVAPLQAWAQLLDLPHRLLRADADVDPPSLGPQVIVVPPDSGINPRSFVRNDGDLLLVLPAGLHPRRLTRLLEPWWGSGIAVCLTGLRPDDPPQPDELMTLAAAGVQLRLTCWGDEVMDSLALADAGQLFDWAYHWCAEAGLSIQDIPEECVA